MRKFRRLILAMNPDQQTYCWSLKTTRVSLIVAAFAFQRRRNNLDSPPYGAQLSRLAILTELQLEIDPMNLRVLFAAAIAFAVVSTIPSNFVQAGVVISVGNATLTPVAQVSW